MNNFCRGVNLLAFISHSVFPTVRKFKDLVEKWFGKAVADEDEMEQETLRRAFAAQNGILDDMENWAEELVFNDLNVACLSDDDYLLLVQAVQSIPTTAGTRYQSMKVRGGGSEVGESVANAVDRRESLVIRQARYRATEDVRRSKHKDSLVEYRTVAGGKVVGRISNIFLHRRMGTTDAFFKIQRSGDLTAHDVPFDVYRTFSNLDARLFYEDTQGEDIVPAANILRHIAYCPFEDGRLSKKAFVGLSLCRVSSFKFSFYSS